MQVLVASLRLLHHCEARSLAGLAEGLSALLWYRVEMASDGVKAGSGHPLGSLPAGEGLSLVAESLARRARQLFTEAGDAVFSMPGSKRVCTPLFLFRAASALQDCGFGDSSLPEAAASLVVQQALQTQRRRAFSPSVVNAPSGYGPATPTWPCNDLEVLLAALRACRSSSMLEALAPMLLSSQPLSWPPDFATEVVLLSAAVSSRHATSISGPPAWSKEEQHCGRGGRAVQDLAQAMLGYVTERGGELRPHQWPELLRALESLSVPASAAWRALGPYVTAARVAPLDGPLAARLLRVCCTAVGGDHGEDTLAAARVLLGSIVESPQGLSCDDLGGIVAAALLPRMGDTHHSASTVVKGELPSSSAWVPGSLAEAAAPGHALHLLVAAEDALMQGRRLASPAALAEVSFQVLQQGIGHTGGSWGAGAGSGLAAGALGILSAVAERMANKRSQAEPHMGLDFVNGPLPQGELLRLLSVYSRIDPLGEIAVAMVFQAQPPPVYASEVFLVAPASLPLPQAVSPTAIIRSLERFSFARQGLLVAVSALLRYHTIRPGSTGSAGQWPDLVHLLNAATTLSSNALPSRGAQSMLGYAVTAELLAQAQASPSWSIQMLLGNALLDADSSLGPYHQPQEQQSRPPIADYCNDSYIPLSRLSGMLQCLEAMPAAARSPFGQAGAVLSRLDPDWIRDQLGGGRELEAAGSGRGVVHAAAAAAEERSRIAELFIRLQRSRRPHPTGARLKYFASDLIRSLVEEMVQGLQQCGEEHDQHLMAAGKHYFAALDRIIRLAAGHRSDGLEAPTHLEEDDEEMGSGASQTARPSSSTVPEMLTQAALQYLQRWLNAAAAALPWEPAISQQVCASLPAATSLLRTLQAHCSDANGVLMAQRQVLSTVGQAALLLTPRQALGILLHLPTGASPLMAKPRKARIQLPAGKWHRQSQPRGAANGPVPEDSHDGSRLLVSKRLAARLAPFASLLPRDDLLAAMMALRACVGTSAGRPRWTSGQHLGEAGSRHARKAAAGLPEREALPAMAGEDGVAVLGLMRELQRRLPTLSMLQLQRVMACAERLEPPPGACLLAAADELASRLSSPRALAGLGSHNEWKTLQVMLRALGRQGIEDPRLLKFAAEAFQPQWASVGRRLSQLHPHPLGEGKAGNETDS